MFKIKLLDTGEVLEVTSASQLANTKVRVSSPEESEAFQQEAFKLGLHWSFGQELRSAYSQFLFVSPILEGQLEYSDSEPYFFKHRARQFEFLPSQPQQNSSDSIGAKHDAEEVADVLSDCILQIEYLHDKFTATGSGNNVLNRARVLLEKLETGQRGAITPEALEAEPGWEKKGFEIYQKGRVNVAMCEGEFCLAEVLTPSGNHASPCHGASSMSDLRTLDRLVNGPTI